MIWLSKTMTMTKTRLGVRRIVLTAASPRSIAACYSSSALGSMANVTATTSTPTSSSIPYEANPDNFPAPTFWIPREKREGRSVFVADNTMWFGQSRLKRNDRRCPSRDLNFTALDCTYVYSGDGETNFLVVHVRGGRANFYVFFRVQSQEPLSTVASCHQLDHVQK